MLHQTRQTMAIEGERAYAVYDGKTGRVVHLHKVVIFSGAAGCSPQEEEERALTLAGAAVTAPSRCECGPWRRVSLST